MLSLLSANDIVKFFYRISEISENIIIVIQEISEHFHDLLDFFIHYHKYLSMLKHAIQWRMCFVDVCYMF